MLFVLIVTVILFFIREFAILSVKCSDLPVNKEDSLSESRSFHITLTANERLDLLG